jgi:hypothetical protein
MSGSYELAWVPGTKRLNFSLHGVWDAQTMARWDADYRAAVGRAPAGGWVVVGDMTDHPAQSESIQRGHEALMAFSAQSGLVRAALIVPKVVAAMQMKRLAGQAHADMLIHFVSTGAEADTVIAGDLAAMGSRSR